MDSCNVRMDSDGFPQIPKDCCDFLVGEVETSEHGPCCFVAPFQREDQIDQHATERVSLPVRQRTAVSDEFSYSVWTAIAFPYDDKIV